MRPKALFTASTFSHILNFHLPYLQLLKEKGWLLHVACGGKTQLVPYADEVFSLPLEKKMQAAGNWRAAYILRQKITAEHYALISTHTSLAAFFTRLALVGLPPGRRPLVLNMVHGYLFDAATPAPKRNLLLAAERLTAGQTDLLLTMNSWDYATARRYRLGRQIANIPGVGVNFARFDAMQNPAKSQKLRAQLGLQPDDFVLIYPAEFSRRKNQIGLLKVLQLLPPACQERLTLLLPGSGALRDECQQLAEQMGLAGRVILPGQLPDMPLWYGLADAAISASRSEGLPFNIMEAMYAGLPVLASAVKGHTDLLQEGVTGLLYPYGDYATCARQLERLLNDRALRQRLGRQARQSVQQYGLAQVRPQVWAEYSKLLNRITT